MWMCCRDFDTYFVRSLAEIEGLHANDNAIAQGPLALYLCHRGFSIPYLVAKALV